jgi:hypothetical protein
MIRTLDPVLFNRVCNHPDVRPWLGGEGEIDTSPFVSDPQNYALWFGEGGFILHAGPAASFEVHSQFTPEGRSSSFEAMRAGMDYMFTRTNAVQLTTFLPDNNPAAKGLALKGGFRPWFRRETSPLGPGSQARIELDDWIVRTPDLEADGERFHAAVTGAVQKARPELPAHPEDKVHDRYVGAVLRMFERGQPRKGEAIYNRWAVNAGYTPCRLISEAPPTLDVSEPGLRCIVGLHDGEVEVLACQ